MLVNLKKLISCWSTRSYGKVKEKLAEGLYLDSEAVWTMWWAGRPWQRRKSSCSAFLGRRGSDSLGFWEFTGISAIMVENTFFKHTAHGQHFILILSVCFYLPLWCYKNKFLSHRKSLSAECLLSSSLRTLWPVNPTVMMKQLYEALPISD